MNPPLELIKYFTPAIPSSRDARDAIKKRRLPKCGQGSRDLSAEEVCRE